MVDWSLRLAFTSLRHTSHSRSYIVTGQQLYLEFWHAMQANDGSSPGGRAALLRLSTDLKLHPIIVAAALEYAFDHQHAFPSAGQALCFGVIRQGYCANMQMLELPLQRLQKDFGGMWNIELRKKRGESDKRKASLARQLYSAYPQDSGSLSPPLKAARSCDAVCRLFQQRSARWDILLPRLLPALLLSHHGQCLNTGVMICCPRFQALLPVRSVALAEICRRC